MIIERIENDIVVIEDDNGNHFEVPEEIFAQKAEEGDFIVKTDNGFIVDVNKTSELRKKMVELQNSLWN